MYNAGQHGRESKPVPTGWSIPDQARANNVRKNRCRFEDRAPTRIEGLRVAILKGAEGIGPAARLFWLGRPRNKTTIAWSGKMHWRAPILNYSSDKSRRLHPQARLLRPSPYGPPRRPAIAKQ